MGLTSKWVDPKGSPEKLLKALDEKEIAVGVLGKSGSNVITKATVNEYGAKLSNGAVIPERSFIRKTKRTKENKINTLIERSVNDLLEGEITTGQFFDRIGEYNVGLVRKTIKDTLTPPNAPSTLEQKAPKTHPLIDTGELRKSIAYEVRGRSSK